MKVFLIDFSSPIMINVARELKKRSVKIIYWTGQKRRFEEAARDKEYFPGTVFHNNLDAVRGIGAQGIDCSDFDPPGSVLIREMLECESITLTMMTRLDWKNISILKKKHLYYKYLQYWSGVLKKLNPDMIIFRAVPHAAYNFVLYSLAKKYNIRTIMFDTVPLDKIFYDQLVIIRDYKKVRRELYDVYEKIKDEAHTIHELDGDKQEYYKKLTDKKSDATPYYKKEIVLQMNDPLRAIPPLKKIVKNIRSGTFLKTAHFHIKSIFNTTTRPMFTINEDDKSNYRNIYQLKKIKKISDRYIQEYRQLQAEVDYNKKFIYFPLHYQPECNTSPMADHFVDQILMIKTISAAIPPDWIIYVKEHISQWGNRNAQAHLFRYPGYYKEIADIKNARLIAPEISTYNLINSAQAVSTATGMAGWEALARGKTILFFGYPWYMHCDGAFKVSDVKSCKDVVKRIINGYRPDSQKFLNHFIALEKTTFKGNIMPYMQKVNNFSTKESVKNITNIILRELKK